MPRAWFLMPLSNERNQGFWGKWLIPRLGQGKYKMSLEYHAVPEIKKVPRTSLEVQWLRLHAPNAGDTGLIPWLGELRIPHAAWHCKKKKKCSKNGGEISRHRSQHRGTPNSQILGNLGNKVMLLMDHYL